MAKITITVNEDEITKLVTQQIADAMASQHGKYSSELRIGMRSGIEKAVKSYIYDHKDVIIEKCVSRASAELVRKGIPKLIERIEQEG